MRIFRIRSCIVRIHPLFFLLILALFFGAADIAAAFLCVLFLHESAHFLCAVLMHLPITQLEITPFGGCMQIEQLDALPAGKSILLSAAGVLSNIAFALLAFLIAGYNRLYFPFLLYFIVFNLAMLLLNLLPVLPLDGGRILLALLSIRFDRRRVLKGALLGGRIFAVCLIVFGFISALSGQTHFSVVLLGFYLLYSAAIEEKTGESRYLAAFISRRVRFEKHRILPEQTFCAAASLPIFMLISHLKPGAYHTVQVLQDDTLSFLGVLREEDILSAVLDRPYATLGSLLSS
ncbi:MAG: hypothetical protein IKW00_06610 [Clostridia bacterium]|nr:hypothetical protein [Clostridia bacterium]